MELDAHSTLCLYVTAVVGSHRATRILMGGWLLGLRIVGDVLLSGAATDRAEHLVVTGDYLRLVIKLDGLCIGTGAIDLLLDLGDEVLLTDFAFGLDIAFILLELGVIRMFCGW